MKDSKNIARLDALRSEFESMRNTQIRVEADIERSAADLEKHKAAAIEEIGTADEGEIRNLIQSRYDENTADVDAFEALIAEIRNGIAQLATESGQATPETRSSAQFRNRAA